MTANAVEKFTAKCLKFLELEAQAERERISAGRALIGEVAGVESGLGGTTLVRLERLSISKQFSSGSGGGAASGSESKGSSNTANGDRGKGKGGGGGGGKKGNTNVDTASSSNAGPPSTIISTTGARFSPGDPITLFKASEGSASGAVSGVVESVGNKFMAVAMDDFDDEWCDEKVVVVLAPNDLTYRRIKQVLNAPPAAGPVGPSRGLASLLAFDSTPARRVVEVAFGSATPESVSESQLFKKAPVFFNPGLNDSQQRAVLRSLASKDIFCILGPPGSGKSTAVTEVVCQLALTMGQKVLVCTPSNIAADSLVEKLAPYCRRGGTHAMRMVRIGHTARVLASVVEYALACQVDRSEGASIVRDIKKDISSIHRQIQKLTSREKAKRSALRFEARTLNKELRAKEEKAVWDLVASTNVVVCTLIGSCDRYLNQSNFDVVVLDEAAMALEAASWIPILRASKVILAGDPFQLPPTILNDQCARSGFGVTLFERLFKKFGDAIHEMLDVQYRMNRLISEWSSNEFYKGKLKCDGSVEEHLLCDMEGVTETEETSHPMVWIDTVGMDYEETSNDLGSKYNENEAEVVMKYVKLLKDAGVPLSAIGVITPYSAQVEFLTRRFMDDRGGDDYSELEISTVDGFQGREMEAIVISMVRSNTTQEVGFLADQRRMNVAVTRARRHVCIIGDSRTLSADAFLKRLFEYFEANAEMRTPFDYNFE